MKTKHTPGPWTQLPARTLNNIKGANGEQICQVPIGKPSEPHLNANARLIAAAPELLEALVALTSNAVCSGMSAAIRDEDHKNKKDDSYKMALEAIAKAQGKK